MALRQQCIIPAPVMVGWGHEANAAVTMPPVYCTLIINFWTAALAAFLLLARSLQNNRVASLYSNNGRGR